MTTVQDNPPAIMIVEDDERLADLTCEYLQANGLEVTVVSDGEEAIRRIRAEQPDLVVLDLMLPGADGLTVCREVRSAYKNPILMLTARTDDMDQVLGLEMGADDYVAKPVKPRVLLARIRALLRDLCWTHDHLRLRHPLRVEREVARVEHRDHGGGGRRWDHDRVL
ncbi:MAG: response regulator, partial [Saprospiraceae bacterium]|nr:response regulator [Saprospiraceae bacterium]